MKRNIMRLGVFFLGVMTAAVVAWAGDAVVDNLTVSKDAVFYGNVDVKSMARESVTNGIVLFFDFAANTTPVPDLSGNNNTGTVSGATWTSEGLANGAYRFDGNDSLSVTCNSTLQLNGWTLSCWFKLDNTDDPFDLISRGFHLGDYRNYQMSVLGGKLYCMYEDISGTDATAEWSGLLTLNTWYHAAYVYDGSQTYLYVNGFLLSSHAQSITPRTNQTDALKIGEYPGWSMKGIIDEVRVYNRGLSSAEILSLYNYYSPANAPTNNLNVAGDVLISGKVAAESLEGKGAGLTDIPDTALTSGADFMKASVWSAGQAWSNTNKVDHAETAEAAGFAFSSDSAYVSEYAWLWGSWGGPAIYAPSGQGSAGQILATDGSGSTYWTDIGTSADSSDLSMGTFTNRPAQ